MLREKEHSPKLFLNSTTLDFISSVASFYGISRSEVVEWAICASLRPYDKAFKIATRRIYARCQAEKKVQNARKQQGKTKSPSTQEGLKSKQLFDPRAY